MTGGFPYRIIARILTVNGYRVIHRGKHIKWGNDNGDTIVIPNREINRMMWKRLCKEHNLQHLGGTDI